MPIIQMSAASVIVYLTGGFITAQIRRCNDIVVACGLPLVLAAAVSLVTGNVYSARGQLKSALVVN
ncbi:MAG: hypothetical protein AB9919_02635 [Geobacteraceae bacterium]